MHGSIARVVAGFQRQWRSPLGRWGLVMGGVGVALFAALRIFVAPALSNPTQVQREIVEPLPAPPGDVSPRPRFAQGALP